MPEKSKKEVIVREIPARIKEITKIENKKESELEREVEEATIENTAQFFSNEGISQEEITPILRISNERELQSDNSDQFSQTRNAREDQSGFSQSLSYNASQQTTRASYTSSSKTSQEINPSLAQDSSSNRQDRADLFDGKELRHLRGEDSHDNIIDIPRPQKEKRRYPWDV